MLFNPLPQHRKILHNIQIALFRLTKLIFYLINGKNQFSALLVSTTTFNRHFTAPQGLGIIMNTTFGLKIIDFQFQLLFITNG